MFFHLVINELEPFSELMVKRVGIVSNDIKTAALRRTIGAERGDDDMASRLHGVRDLLHISATLVGFD